jgi:hypothetical protein
MTHLTDEQLGALHDGALAEREADAARRHVGECAACRGRLDELAALERSLAGALEHDPGEAYFADFERRVAARIATEPVPAAPRRGIAAWWNSPRALAWAGGVAGLVAVSALVATLAGKHGPQELARVVAPQAGRRAPAAADRANESAPRRGAASEPAAPPSREPAVRDFAQPPPAPSARREAQATPAPADERGALAQAPAPEAAANEAPAASALARKDAASQRAIEVRTSPEGEPVPVPTHTAPAPPAPTPIRLPGGLLKPGATPLGGEGVASKSLAGAPPAPATATPEARLQAAPSGLASTGGSAGRADVSAVATLCGTVTDPKGQPVAGAVVSVAETGRTAVADAQGGWCVAMPASGGTLSVLAVGFREYRASVPPDAAGRPWAASLTRVDALASPAPGRTGGAPVAGFYSFLTSPSAGENAARRAATAAESLATRNGSAGAWDRAAEAWERVAAVTRDAALEEPRFHVAQARVNAWKAGATEARRAAASLALRNYLALAPEGVRRGMAEGWEQSLGR